jgi:hypothetical protein
VVLLNGDEDVVTAVDAARWGDVDGLRVAGAVGLGDGLEMVDAVGGVDHIFDRCLNDLAARQDAADASEIGHGAAGLVCGACRGENAFDEVVGVAVVDDPGPVAGVVLGGRDAQRRCGRRRGRADRGDVAGGDDQADAGEPTGQGDVP